MKVNEENIKSNLLLQQFFNQFIRKFESNAKLYDDHPAMKGGNNEQLLVSLLRNFLPKKYKFETNKKIVDFNGVASPEQDIIIWNSLEMPRIFPNSDFFLFETVSVAIEVKTMLNKKNLIEAIENIRNLRKLGWKKEVPANIFSKFNQNPENPMIKVNPPLNIIFAYDCIWKTRTPIYSIIREILEKNDYKTDEVFDYIYILRYGILIGWDDPKIKMMLDERGGPLILPRRPKFLPFRIPNHLRNHMNLSILQITHKKADNPNQFGEITEENRIKYLHLFITSVLRCLDEEIKMPTSSIVHMCWKYSKKSIGSGGSSGQIWGYLPENKP